MGLKTSNNAYGALATGVSATDSVITLGSGQGARFPALLSGDWSWATLSNAANQIELVKVLALAGDSFTVQRGVDGQAYAYLAGDRLDMRPCAQAMNDKLDVVTATATYAKLAGGNKFTGVQTVDAQRFKFLSLGSVSAPVAISFAASGTVSFTATTTSVAVTFTNPPPAGEDGTMYLKITNGGGRVTFPGAKVSKGVALAMTAAGKDLLAVWYDSEDQVYVVGFAFQDYK